MYFLFFQVSSILLKFLEAVLKMSPVFEHDTYNLDEIANKTSRIQIPPNSLGWQLGVKHGWIDRRSFEQHSLTDMFK